LIDQAIAALIGSGVSIAEPTGNMVIVMGGGVTEAAVVSMGGVIYSQSIAKGGRHLDEAIEQYLRKEKNCTVSLAKARELKHTIASAGGFSSAQQKSQRKTDITVRNPSGGAMSVTLDAQDFTDLTQTFLNQTVRLAESVLQHVPPELSGDIVYKGILVCGGGASLHFADAYLSKALSIPVTVPDEPDMMVLYGMAEIAHHLDTYKRLFGERG